MQFLITGLDGCDKDAPARRSAAREAHLQMGDRLKASGNMLFAAALLNEDGQMIGSSIVCEFASRADLDSWLKDEPYVTGKVWQSVEITACKVSPSFSPAALKA